MHLPGCYCDGFIKQPGLYTVKVINCLRVGPLYIIGYFGLARLEYVTGWFCKAYANSALINSLSILIVTVSI